VVGLPVRGDTAGLSSFVGPSTASTGTTAASTIRSAAQNAATRVATLRRVHVRRSINTRSHASAGQDAPVLKQPSGEVERVAMVRVSHSRSRGQTVGGHAAVTGGTDSSPGDRPAAGRADGPDAAAAWPDGTIPTRAPDRDDAAVQLLASPRVVRLPLGPAIAGTLAGAALLGGGLFLLWLAFATPVVGALAPHALRPTLPELALGGVVWGVALVAPPCFAFVGAWRLARVIRALTVRPAVPVLVKASAELGDDFVAASQVRLPDGRVIRNVVVGPFGLAVITEMPPTRLLRRTGNSWEARGPGGRWVHMENPLDRAARDAERVRRWFASVDRDYVLKVFAALVTTESTIERTPTCAVLTPEQVPGWLAALPPARALTPDRRDELVEQIAELL
jgi:hypothetical protein